MGVYIMSVYIDRKYLGSISHKLERFSQKNPDLYNFRCPFCGDSKKNKLKSRGYIFRKDNDYYYRCHNCSVSFTFSNFLKQIDVSAHKQYVLERYAAGDNGHSNYKKPTFDELRGNAFAHFAQTIPKFNLESITDLSEEHHAREYILKRGIPKSRWNDIYYTEAFKDFLDREFPDHGKENIPNDERIVLLYRDEGGNITNVAGRALGKSKIRYITIKIAEGKKIYGLERINKENKVYVVEGQFDSMFLDNCIASGDSNLSAVSDYIGIASDIVLIWDNEPRNKEIVKTMESAIDAGHNVVIWQQQDGGKDINEMVLNGIDVQSIVQQRTFCGATAKLEFIKWKRC